MKSDLSTRFEMKARAKVAQAKETITCRPGCAYCCYHPIMISALEAIPLYRFLQRKGRWTDKLKVKLVETSDKQYGAAFEVWLYSMIACPLLDEKNMCMGYEARPLICRSYYATSDPELCHPHRLGEGTKILDRTEAVEPFHKKIEQILLRHKLQFLAMPIGTALLLAEKICTGQLDLESVDREVLMEYVEKA